MIFYKTVIVSKKILSNHADIIIFSHRKEVNIVGMKSIGG